CTTADRRTDGVSRSASPAATATRTPPCPAATPLGWEKAIDVPRPEARFLTVVPPGATTQLVLAHPSTHDTDTRSKYSGISPIAPDIDATYETLSKRG